MNEEQKQRAKDLIVAWKSAVHTLHADRMVALLQELIDAPGPQPVLVVEVEPDYWHRGHYCEGTKSYIDPTRVWGLPAGTKLYAAPTQAEAPADVARWIDPRDKTQKQFLPHIGERVLFCRDGKTYYGKHTGGSFISFTNPGKYYPTWDCHWMYPPKAIDAAIERQGGE